MFKHLSLPVKVCALHWQKGRYPGVLEREGGGGKNLVVQGSKRGEWRRPAVPERMSLLRLRASVSNIASSRAL